jgi:cell wall assembly regulator SMI1
MNNEQELAAAWERVDERLAALQRRHNEKGDIPLYEAALNPPATAQELRQLAGTLEMPIPFELAYSLKRWNGRWIAHDHVIDLSPIRDHVYAANASQWREEDAGLTFEHVIGPISLIMESKKRICFGGHEYSGSGLYLDYEDPPEGGHRGQVIRIGEEPIAEFVAASFVDFLNLIAAAPANDDEPDFDPLAWRP